MCGRICYTRYALQKAQRLFGFAEEFQAAAEGTINPSDLTVIIGGKDGEYSVQEAKWGFAGKEGSLVINARSESIFTKPMFSSSALYRRCLVPAERFFEWTPEKEKVGFKDPNTDVMYLAGLWKYSENELRFVVITAPANKSVSDVHDRMPLLIGESEARAWIFDEKEAQKLLGKTLPDLVQIREEEQLKMF